MKSRRSFARACAVLLVCLNVSFALAQTGTALVRHAPDINAGTVDGSVQQVLGESLTLNGGAVVTGDLLVPGTPTVRLNGRPTYAGTLDGSGATSPANYQVTLNGNVRLRNVIRRTDPTTLPAIAVPPQPTGTRTVVITSSNQSAGDFTTLRHLTLNGGVGQFAIPPGTYGDFTANGGSGFTLGIPGSMRPVVYNFQRLTLNGQTEIRLAGPVIINLANGFAANGTLGLNANPSWLALNVYSGGFTLNGGCVVYGYVSAPTGTVIVNGHSQLIGGVVSDRLVVNGSGVLRLQPAVPFNQSPIAHSENLSTNEDTPKPLTLTGSDADGDPLTFAILTLPAHGTLSGAAPNLTYIPAANYHGTDSFTFKANDGEVDSAPATIALTVIAVNDPPIADAKTVEPFNEDTSANIILTGSDVEGSALTFAISTEPQHGTLSGTGATRTYTPHPNYFGHDQFSYVAHDGIASSTTPAVVTLSVRPVNDAPVAASLSRSGRESADIAITLSATDADNDTLSFSILGQPAHGTLSGTAPNLVYRSAQNFSGVDTFTYKASDGQADSNIATVTLAIDNPNDPPTAQAQTVAITEDTPKLITLTGADPDGTTLTFEVLTPPQHGTLSGGTGAARVYTPDTNYSGPDSFTFRVSDGTFNSSPATVTINVEAVNDAPVATGQSRQTAEDTPIALTLSGTDVEGGTLTFSVVAEPQNGVLTGTGATRIYTPNANFNGTDTFTFKVNDGTVDSAPATISLTITPVNDPPTAASQTVSTVEDTALVVTLAGADVETSPLTFSIITPPQHGTYTLDGAKFTYTPTANYHGPDSFVFRAHDGELESVLAATVSISITPQNDAPVAASQTLDIPENAPATLTLGASDIDGDALTYTVLTQPAHGTLSGTGPNLTYTPAPNYVGPDSFTFKATDPAPLDSNTATVSLVVFDVNTPPVAANQAIEVDEDTARTFALTVTDADNDALAYTLITPPSHGVLANFPNGSTATPPTIAYTPAVNFAGTDSFTYQVRDGSATPAQATVTFTIRAINDAPAANAQARATPEDVPLPVVLAGADAENSALTFVVLTQPARGVLSGTPPNLTYTPKPNLFGADSFTFKVNDGQLDSAPATIAITVTPVNDAPVAALAPITVAEDTSVAVVLTATDVENDPLTFSYTQPAHGSLSGTAPNLTYTPHTNYFGLDSFTYKARDTGPLESISATVSITVTPVNDRPTANAQTIFTRTGTPTEITLTGSDIENSPLTFSVVSPPQHGTLSGTSPNLIYTSAADFGGFDSFTFKANDGGLDSSPATVLITSGLPPRSRTYTTTADFTSGALIAVDTNVPDQISNQIFLASFDVVWIASSSKGTVIKLDTETGRVLGEYLSAPSSVVGPYPSRIAVDSKGNAWVANLSHNSIVKIGDPANGFFADRSQDGTIQTSSEFGDVLAWNGTDLAGATDEAILLYVRTDVSSVKQISIDADDNVWVGGASGDWQKFDGRTGALLRTEPSIGQGGNGGYIAADGKMYSTSRSFLIWDVARPIASLAQDDKVRSETWSSALDSQGNLWTTRDWTSTVVKYSPTGEVLGEYYHGEPWAMGIAIDANDHVWVAHSHCGHSVGHLLPNGQFLGNVEVANHGPVEVSIDRRGRIWVVSSTGVVERINPLAGPLGSDGMTPVGEVDVRSGHLGGALWTYGRFTGSSFGLSSPDGIWTAVYDGQLAGTTWGPVVANGIVANDGRVEIEAALSANGTTFGPFQPLTLEAPAPSGSGRYLKTRVRLVSSTTGETPVLHDLTIGTTGYTPPSTTPSWSVSAGADIAGNWPDVIQLKGAFVHSLHSFPTEPTYAWSVVSKPNGASVTFSNPATKAPTAQFSAQGTYVLRLTAALGAQTSTDDVQVVLTPYNRAPYPNAGYTIFRADHPPQLWLWGTVRDDGLPIGATVTTQWEKLFGPGTVTFTDPSSPATTASFSAPGVYVLRLKASDGALAGEDMTTVWLGYSCIPTAPEGLVSWWQAAGNGDDHIGGNQAFTERGADFVEGKIGGAFRFDGVNDRVRVFSAPTLDTGAGQGFTLEFWLNPATHRTATIFEYGQNTTHGVTVRQLGSSIEVNFREVNGTSHTLTTGGVVPTGSWTHVTASYDRASGEARIYINGTPHAVQTIGSFALATGYDVFMGAGSNLAEFYHGLLDEVSVYKRALYADEVTTIVSHPAGKRPPVSNLPPTVNAGRDLNGKVPNTPVALNGVVTDDGQPSNGALFTMWTKVAGPGIVSFADPTKPSTTVTFSEGGIYTLKLLADDGGFCSEDLVDVRVGALFTVETDSSLAAWWPANGTDLDQVSKRKLERFNGAAFTEGEVAQGFSFDGGDDHGRVAASPALDLGTTDAGFTIELWAKPSRNQDVPLVQWATDSVEGLGLRQWSYGTGLYAFMIDTNGNARHVAAEGVFTANVWTHVAMTYDRPTGWVRLYRNGNLVREQFIGSFTHRTTYPIQVGSLVREGRYYQGALDEITLYRRPLTIGEINAIYQSGIIGKAPLDDNQPPSINAGSDVQVFTASGTAMLNGIVTDDGRPEGTLTVAWSRVDGPGIVSFANVTSASTTATFSAPGTYILRLDANDGLNQAQGHTVVVRVGLSGTVETDSALAAWWPANGDPHEIVRGGHDMEFYQGMSYGDGRVGQAFVLDGANDHGRVAAHPDLDIGASPAGFTIELWVKPRRNQDVPLVQWATNTVEGVGLRQWSYGTGLYAFMIDTSGNARHVAAEGILTADVWTHVALTYDRVTGWVRLYRDANLVREQNIGSYAHQTTYPMQFGSLVREGRYFQGSLDEPSLYTRPLTVGEITAIYRAGATGKNPPDDNQPPVANAGPDVHVSSATGAAILNGIIQDDGRPVGGTLSATWSKVDGPGIVTFANVNAAATTATFGAAGTYVLRLDASDGFNQVSDTAVVRVGLAGVVESDASLAAWWPANGDPHEVIRGGHDMEFYQGMTYGEGRVSQGFVLDGANDHGRVAAHADLDIGKSPAGFTVELWAKPSRNQDVPLVQWATDSVEGVGLRQWSYGTGLYAFMIDTSGNARHVAAEGVFTPNAWTHVAMTYDKPSGWVRLYRNGVLVREQYIGVFTHRTSYPMQFGSLVRESRYFQGTLDEVSLYTRPLSIGEIDAIYQAGAIGKNPPDANQPPVANAGPDVQVFTATGTAQLAGTVTDDGRPGGGILTSTWSKVDGPGTVTFADPSSATTTATFSAPGTYVLRLDANDGFNQAKGDVVVVRVARVGSVEAGAALAAWWPANGDPHEVLRGGHDVEFYQGMGYGAGRVSQAFLFDGANDHGRVAAHPDLNIGASPAGFTIELWARPSRNQDVPLVQWATDSVEGLGLRQWNYGTGLYAFMIDTSGNARHVAAEGMFTADVWTHVALTYDRPSGWVRLYRNAVLVREQHIGSFAHQTGYPMQFGSLVREGRYYRGALDEVSLYTRPLTVEELAAIYQADITGKNPLDDNQPPVVSAGPDLQMATGPATLAGSVTDDGRPAGGTLTVAWSKVEGPGNATFGNQNAAATTVTFDAPGTYILRLDANDGFNQAKGDTVVVRLGVPASVGPDAALAAWWPANADPHEVVRGGHDVELFHGAGYGAGQVTQAFVFDGANDYGRTAAHADLDIGNASAGLTIELWAKPSRNQDAPLVQWATESGEGLGLRQWSYGTGLYAFMIERNGNARHVAAEGMFTANVWTHVAMTYDRATGIVRLYRNGALVREQAIGSFAHQTSYPILFGALPREGRYYAGALDEITFYTRPLAGTEINAIYQAGATGKNPVTSNVPPSVVFASPASGTSYEIDTPIALSVFASDTDGAISKVEFFDGVTKLGETTTADLGQPTRFTFTQAGGLALGTHAVSARVTDNQDGAASTHVVRLAIVPVLPAVALTVPANNATVSANTPLTIGATATYSVGALAKVEFYDGAVKLGESTAPEAGSSYQIVYAPGLSGGGHRLTAKAIAADGAVATSAPILITATALAPTVALTSPGNNSTLAANTTFTLGATANDADGTITKVEFFRGLTKLGEDATSPYTLEIAAGLPVGSYSFTAKATDNSGLTSASAAVDVTFTTYSGPPVAEIIAPAEDARLSAPTAVTGVIAHSALASWALDYRLRSAEGAPAEPWITFASGNSLVGTPAIGSSPTVPGTIGTFDPTRLINGIYELQLRMTDTGGSTEIAGPVTVVVEGNMKVGAFSLAFEDLKVPVAGIPISITRTYDSRDTRVGDFGPGWRLALNNIRVQKNRHLGFGWWQTPQSGDGFQFYFVEPLRERIVTVTMPDGETHRFRAGAYVKNREGDPDNASFAVVARQGLYKFYPLGDTTSKLEPLDNANQLYDRFWIDGTTDRDLYAGEFGDLEASVFNVTRYRLTTSDGTVFILDEALGLLEMRDLDGNTLVLNRDAQNRVTSVTSTQNAPGGSIARSVTIVRDATGRVDYIRDPAGKDLDYIYDAQGRLESFTDRELNVTQFRYENAAFPYYLTKIIDPRGVAALRSEYDPTTGKLIKQIDADGKETVFNRGIDSTGRFEKIKDRLGHETTFYYDERGNVTLKIDPLGAQTSYSYWPGSDRVKFETDHYGNVKSMAYDERGNVTVQTIGASTSEDPANPTTGYTTRTTYNANSAPTRITDPDGRVQTFTYDTATNNLLTHTVGFGGTAPATTTYTYKSDGTLDTITDAVGNVTRHVYDYAFSDPAYPGAVKQVSVSVTDPAGAPGSDPANSSATVLRITRTLFDAQENQLAQIVRRTLPNGTPEDVVTRYFYDAENRLVATLMPDGRVTETRYTSFGKEDKTLLWKTSADYETRNDTLARVTSYGYDSRGNQISITHADGTSESTAFDLENRKTWSQDRRGYRTFFAYDKVGRLVATIHPDADDSSGAGVPPVSLTDSRLANNPRTQTEYDLVGRVRFQIDERGAKTEFTYEDGCGCAMRRRQMIQHRTAGNLVTHYQYDQAGNVRYVTDPRGNTVETRYDDHGRPRLVIYPATDEHPATQTETKYDLLGRRTEIVDQEGKITRYRYDALGRLVEVRQYLDQSLAASDTGFTLAPTTAGFAATRYTYDALGNQQTQTDALGRTTTYWTDQLGRRTQRILPKDTSETTALTETLQYDGWGNLWKRTDFAGKTTTFGYDALNRLKSKTADPTHPSLAFSHAIARIEYDYDANGARTAARAFNASDTQLYSESTPRDERGRLDYKDVLHPTPARLDYDYYANNQLKAVDSSNDAGISVGYRYDELNRLESVDDASTGLPTRTTSYAYNANGSLETVTQPNGVVHTYGYDALNRLRGLVVARGTTPIHTYEYKLRASGHRRQVIENSTKTTTYTYDDLYRLTGESIAGDANANNGDIGYTLDKVGNRLSRSSQLSAVSAQLNQTYNARDWLNGDTYTPNGSTQVGRTVLGEPPATDTYDFEERLILRTKVDGTTINISYDADGHRIAKNLLNASAQPISSTTWLVDTNNLTGYAQALEERVATNTATTLRVYTYGSDLISQATAQILPSAGAATIQYYAYDGHGSTRELTDGTGTVTDRYDYDAFGNLVFQSGTTPNAYRYSGEQYDADLGLYYNRARYLNTDLGRFWSMDPYEGPPEDPPSLHKYLYANGDPVNGSDPSGYWTLFEVSLTQIIDGIKNTISVPSGAYVRRKGIKKLACVVGVSAAERWIDSEFSVHGHHPIPKSHGGLADQALLFLPASTHRAFHFIYNVFLRNDPTFKALGLHNSSPAGDWEEAFKKNPKLKKAALQILKKAARVIDKKCSLPKGLSLETYIKKNERRWLRGG